VLVTFSGRPRLSRVEISRQKGIDVRRAFENGRWITPLQCRLSANSGHREPQVCFELPSGSRDQANVGPFGDRPPLRNTVTGGRFPGGNVPTPNAGLDDNRPKLGKMPFFSPF
jgi:hypothetical protein